MARTNAIQTCRECGNEFESPRESQFCGTKCRKAFNNRRATRGAVLYDMMMEHRYNRASGDASEVRGAMYALVAEWRAEDREQRAGRTSWLDPRNWLAQNSWLRSLRMAHRKTA